MHPLVAVAITGQGLGQGLGQGQGNILTSKSSISTGVGVGSAQGQGLIAPAVKGQTWQSHSGTERNGMSAQPWIPSAQYPGD